MPHALRSNLTRTPRYSPSHLLAALPYRALLFDCARLATENGARRTAWRYYTAARSLLQPNPWVDGEDTAYDETLQLYLRSAECALYLGEYNDADDILGKATNIHGPSHQRAYGG